MIPAPQLRKDLPPLPTRMKRRPVDARGYPVPWFVEWVNGVPDFRIMDGRKRARAITQRLCWLCGEPLQHEVAFVIGPMCAVNRTSAEPPCHLECATFAAIACPFLARPHMRRREAGLPEDAHSAAGVGIRRNPGVALVWVTRTYRPFNDGQGGWLLHLGDPINVRCYAEGRTASAEEIAESIRTGIPLLDAECDREPAHSVKAARAHLAREVVAACALLGIAPGLLLPPAVASEVTP